LSISTLITTTIDVLISYLSGVISIKSYGLLVTRENLNLTPGGVTP